MRERGQILVLTGSRPAEREQRYTTLYRYRLSSPRPLAGTPASTRRPASSPPIRTAASLGVACPAVPG